MIRNFVRRHGMILGMALLVGAAGWLFVQPEHQLKNKIDLAGAIPVRASEFYGEDAEVEGVPVEEQLAPQAFMMRNYYSDASAPVTLCLVYNYQRRSRSFHDPEVCYPAQGYTLYDRGRRDLEVAGHPVKATTLEVEKNSRSYAVVYWYMSGKRAIEDKGGRIGHLSTMVRSRLKRSLGVSAMVRASMPVTGDFDSTVQSINGFLDDVYPHILGVRADLEQDAMPAVRWWKAGIPGKLGIALLLAVPLALIVAGLPGRSD